MFLEVGYGLDAGVFPLILTFSLREKRNSRWLISYNPTAFMAALP
jgi:hypothetical protein